MVSKKITEVNPDDLWHVAELPEEDLDNGMASIVKMVHSEFKSVRRCRIDDNGYIRILSRDTDDYVPKNRYRPISRTDIEKA